ncbi:phage minor capsid protein [Shouchella miscanthi]|uniref:phage minor capsid protein n=1 Tax=Shouchella miscanthi TaxID=2598861 RepID=UPI0011AB0C12|nr:phage minor capsid protein [Shouchella miscanthi]
MNIDQLLRYFSDALEDIYRNVGSIEGLSTDRGAQELIRSISDTLDSLGIAIEEVLPNEILEAYTSGLITGNTLLREEGLAVAGIVKSDQAVIRPILQRKLHREALFEITNSGMEDIRASLEVAKSYMAADINQVRQTFKDDMARGSIQGDHNRVISARISQRFKEHGIVGHRTIDGKLLPIDFYSSTVVRTKLRDANTKGAVNRYTENGVTTVKISGQGQTCQVCARYQNLVVSLTGEHEGFASINDNNIKLPPFHPNCRCTCRPFVLEYKTPREIQEEKDRWKAFDPVKDVRSPTQKRAYEREQKQRVQRNAEKKQYAEMVMLLGDDAPKTLGAFRRMKKANSLNFRDKKAEMRAIKRNAKASSG